MKKVIWFSEFLLHSSYYANEIIFNGEHYRKCFIMRGEYYRKSSGELYFKVMIATLSPLFIIHFYNNRPISKDKIYPIFYEESEEEKILSFSTLETSLNINSWNVKWLSYFRSHWGTKKVIQILKREFNKLNYETDWKD